MRISIANIINVHLRTASYYIGWLLAFYSGISIAHGLNSYSYSKNIIETGELTTATINEPCPRKGKNKGTWCSITFLDGRNYDRGSFLLSAACPASFNIMAHFSTTPSLLKVSKDGESVIAECVPEMRKTLERDALIGFFGLTLVVLFAS
jgi:hypothetical protein